MKDTMIGKYCIIRTHCAGVHMGIVKYIEGTSVLLKKARRLWFWKGAFTLSAVATAGIRDGSLISTELKEIMLTEAIEIIPITLKVKKTYEKYYSSIIGARFGCGEGSGSADGSGYGAGFGYGGFSCGSGDGCGYGDGSGSGCGDGSGYGGGPASGGGSVRGPRPRYVPGSGSAGGGRRGSN